MRSQTHRNSVLTTAAALFLSVAGAGCSGPPAGADTGAGTDPAVSAATGDTVDLPDDPRAALAALRAASERGPVAVFKHSPICPISAAAQERFHAWVGESEAPVEFAQIDVLAEKPLARGLTAALNVKHESPQVLLFEGGELVWHASHQAITGEALTAQLDAR
ncbi:MAG: bacillithiol system redox-active protein YtxJ [Planctomycetota bacterium]